MPKKSNRQFALALYELTKDIKKEDVPDAVQSFLKVIQRNNRLKKIEYIISEYENYAKKREGIKQVEIESAHKLDETVLGKIAKIFGTKSEISTTIDKKMFGGIRVKVDDVILDASLSTQIKRLKNALQ